MEEVVPYREVLIGLKWYVQNQTFPEPNMVDGYIIDKAMGLCK